MRWQGLAVVLFLSGCERATAPEEGSASGPVPPAPMAARIAPGRPGASRSADPDSPPEPTPGEEALPVPMWSARSANGRAEVRQVMVRDAKGSHCVSSATIEVGEVGPSTLWKWDTCLATQTQVPFVSEDGMRVLVIDPSPPLPRGGWQQAEVATLYEHGVRMRVVRAGAAVTTPHLRREPTPGMTWIQGLEGLPGAPPRYTSDGNTVEFETVEGHTLRWSFSGQGLPPQAEEPRSFLASAGMYRYEDDHKTTHFMGSLEEVPAPYRTRAVFVQSQVVVVKSPPLPRIPKGPAPTAPPAKAPAQSASRQEPPKPTTLATPAELLQRTRDTVKQANASQQELQRQLDAVREDAPAPPRPVE